MLGRLNVKLTDVDGSTRTVDVGVFLSAPPSLAPGAAKQQNIRFCGMAGWTN